MASYEPILLRNRGVEGSRTLKVYESRGGYQAVRKALKMTPEAVVEEVKKANLRGRGGAGFPAGMKWSFLPKDRKVTYLCVNGDESEPPTFSNRVLMEHDPHQLIEGVIIAAYAVQAQVAYIYLRVEFHEPFHILQRAVDEAYAKGYLGRKVFGSDFSVDVYVHRGAGAYVCGEETGLIESLEGKRGWPRIKPPFPAIEGLFRKPTIVNNVETLCNVPHIIERGASWFTGVGPSHSTGPKLFCISGPVKKPGCYEGSMDISVKELIEDPRFGGGMRDGKKVKCVLPGGISMGALSASELHMKMDFEDPRKFGLLGLGTAAAVVLDESIDIRIVLRNLARFYAMESCGQCTQCREGTSWMHKIAERIARGAGRLEDLDLILQTARNMGMMPGLSICGLPDGATYPIETVVKKFRGELEERIRAQSPEKAEVSLTVVG
ncbi:MAG: NADH-quinone oxidoreductase subunit NuoF [Phycisphaerae bacterium]|nr:MAG: NADH-quinone oxidoreductase subunit NuoF [Planctomycetota bacterium]KAB2938026.1 MAG: NADH-quinone oxidoreductase subunit NuoF [Phycisphaerae bacterium]MBE7458464.1 NADH-quinone oxidoreductase subunit NuoF [Planctomycetia bacterium]MCL4719207.1 NADH-quinone oxidoreductase subunit NuoF [Phycisphaerae bacterium]MCQ3921441.1 NADH-quinone oxidoreductase subunit NuoF [Planctomycetota bacterium]